VVEHDIEALAYAGPEDRSEVQRMGAEREPKRVTSELNAGRTEPILVRLLASPTGSPGVESKCPNDRE
jgi:hypothetical protein